MLLEVGTTWPRHLSLVMRFQLHSVLQSVDVHHSPPALQVQELARACRDN